MIGLSYCTCVFLVTRPFIITIIFDLVIFTLRFDLLLKNFNLCGYLVLVAAMRATLSSGNSYFFFLLWNKIQRVPSKSCDALLFARGPLQFVSQWKPEHCTSISYILGDKITSQQPLHRYKFIEWAVYKLFSGKGPSVTRCLPISQYMENFGEEKKCAKLSKVVCRWWILTLFEAGSITYEKCPFEK